MDSAEKIEGSLDMLTKILLRLPAKPLFRFKTVSRRWNSLISDHHFSTQWKPTVSGLFMHEMCLNSATRTKYYYVPIRNGDVCWQNMRTNLESIDYTDVQSHIYIQDSVGGLFLCFYKDTPLGYRRLYLICNHTTKRFTPLPDPDACLSDSITLTYDRSRSPHYKVIVVRYEILNSELPLYYHIKVRIYSSETKCWTPWRPDFVTPIFIALSDGVFFKNAVYWPSRQAEMSSLYYDIDGDSFHSFPMPPLPNGETNCQIEHFGVVKGCLLMIILWGSQRRSKYDIYGLEEDCSSWSFKYHVDLDLISRTIRMHADLDLISRVIGIRGLRLMCAFDQEDEEELLLILYTANGFIAYKPTEESFKKLSYLFASHCNGEAYPLETKFHYQFVENPFPLP